MDVAFSEVSVPAGTLAAAEIVGADEAGERGVLSAIKIAAPAATVTTTARPVSSRACKSLAPVRREPCLGYEDSGAAAHVSLRRLTGMFQAFDDC
jgi:hypothetical protein